MVCGKEEVVAYRSWRPVRLTVFIAWGRRPNVVAIVATKSAGLADRALTASSPDARTWL